MRIQTPIILFSIYFSLLSTVSLAATVAANPCYNIPQLCDPIGYGVKKASVEFSSLTAGDLSRDCMNRCLFGETNTPHDEERTQKDPYAQSSSPTVVFGTARQSSAPLGLHEDPPIFEKDKLIKKGTIFVTESATPTEIAGAQAKFLAGTHEKINVKAEASTHAISSGLDDPRGVTVGRTALVKYKFRSDPGVTEFSESLKKSLKFDGVEEIRKPLHESSAPFSKKDAVAIVDEWQKRITGKSLTMLEREMELRRVQVEFNTKRGLHPKSGSQRIAEEVGNRIRTGKIVGESGLRGGVGANIFIMFFDVGFSTGPELWNCKTTCDREIQKMLEEVEEGKCKESIKSKLRLTLKML